ncbi:MAG: hypothetical protein K2F91_06600 [Muribaculaceae bacterium]|nr:hypothetical protein [Muribaculaceae bacterium]
MNCKHACLLGLLAMSAMPFTSCNDDNDWPTVDGAEPTVAIATDHVMTEAGKSVTFAGKITDADGIASINLLCPELQLDKTIDIISIYGEPLKEYDLDYQFKIQDNETGDKFDVLVTVTDVAGKSFTTKVLVTMDGDFSAPVFEAAPDSEITVLIKANTMFNLKFTATDNRAIDYINVDVEGVSGFPVRIEGEGKNRVEYEQKLPLPAAAASYNLTITAYDKAAQDGEVRSTSVTSTIKVSELPDFANMYLADVATAAELNSDIFGVPMVVDHVAPYTYRARYFNEKAGTEICFIPQKTDFTPICFGPDPSDPTILGDDPETVGRIKLDKAGVYYVIDFNISTGSYKLDTYTIDEAIDPVMHMHYGQDDINTWFEWTNLNDIWWQEFFFGPFNSWGDGDDKDKSVVSRMEQSKTNPHVYTLEGWKLNAGDELNFILHCWHIKGWWNVVTWRGDDEADPSRFSYYGWYQRETPHFESNEDYFKWKYIDVDPEEYKFMYPGAPEFDLNKWAEGNSEDYRKNWVADKWTKPTVKVSGTYRLVFDAHLERAKLVPAE